MFQAPGRPPSHRDSIAKAREPFLPSTKQDRRLAEVAAEHFLRSRGCTVTVRAVRTQWQRQDLLAGDCLGKDVRGGLHVVQATAGQDSAVTARRRKLEAIPWADSDFVAVVQLRKMKDPANARRLLRFFRVCEFSIVPHKFVARPWGDQPIREWKVWDEAVPVPPEWLKAARTATQSG